MSAPVPPPVGVMVGIDAIYGLLQRTHDRVIEMAVRLDDQARAAKAAIGALEVRVGSLERWRLMHVAAGAGSAGAVSWVLHATGHA